MEKIILYGFFGSGNIGNDTSFEATLHHVKKHQPDADVICVCNGPGEISKRFGIQALPMTRHETRNQISFGLMARVKQLWLRLMDEVYFWLQRPKWFQPGDKFIVVGSGAIDDYGVRRPWHRPYVLYKWCKAAKLGGAQVIFLSVGAGPIQNRHSKAILLKALRMADYRSYRDVASLNYLQSLGYDTSGDHSYPDLVFSLPKKFLTPAKKLFTKPIVVGLGLINYYGHQYEPGVGEKIYQEYISKIKLFVSWLLEEGYVVRILSGDISDKWPAQDVVEFVRREGEAHWQEKLVVQEISNVDELFNQIAQTDLVIASRFHNVLCSLMLERPVISLGYHEKNDALMKEMGLEKYCHHVEQFTHHQLVEQFNTCIRETKQIVSQIHEQLENYRNLLDDQYKTLLSQQEKDISQPGM